MVRGLWTVDCGPNSVNCNPQLMNPVFEILPEIHERDVNRLFCEVSEESFSYFIQNTKSNLITGLTVFHLDQKNNSEGGALKKILNDRDLLDGNKEVFISYAYPDSLIVPSSFYEEEKNNENLSLFYGDIAPGKILTDMIDKKNMRCIYRVPEMVDNLIKEKFPDAVTSHQYSSMIEKLSNSNSASVIFYQHKIVVMLVANGALKIIQSYHYTAPEDVVYHLLNIFELFNVEERKLILYGMIEKDSALFREIHKYFLDISFGNLPGTCTYADGLKEFPEHYFSHLYSLACG